MNVERWTIRILVGALVVGAVIVALTVALPTKMVDGKQIDALPAVALGQEILYRLEVGVILFYGGLIILTPVFRGAVLGRLPIEISARGAKFAQEVDESLEATQQLVQAHQDQLDDIEKRAIRARLNLDQLASQTGVQFND